MGGTQMMSSFHDKNLLMDFIAYLRINGLTSVSMEDEQRVIERYFEIRFDFQQRPR